MKKVVFRILVILMLLMVLAPFVMVLIRATGWNPFPATQTWSNLAYRTRTETVSDSGVVLNAYILDYNTGNEYSISKYAHYNGTPLGLGYESNYYNYKVGGIEYLFNIQDIDNPQITFYMYPDNTTYVISNDGNNVILTRQGGVPWWRKTTVCPLPSPDCFYSPIRITGASGYAIVLLEPNEDGNETVTVYVKNKKIWEQVDFVFPDGTVASSLNGGARRRFDLSNTESNTQLFNMEVCIPEEEAATLYAVDFSDGQLLLSPLKTFRKGMPTNWTF